MTISASLAVSPSAPAAGATVTATYVVQGNSPGVTQTLSFSGTVELNGTSYPDSTGSIILPGAPAAAVTYAVPVCQGLVFRAGSAAGTFTALVPTTGAGAGSQVVSGSVTVGSSSPVEVSASVTLPSAVTATPTPAAGTVPYPAALQAGHTLLEQYLPEDLYAWRFQPGTTTPVVNGSGVSENPASPRNVAVTTDGGLSVLQLACTSTADCGVIQSPGTYPTSSGVVEALVKFSGFTNASGHFFANWASFWMYGPNWPEQGEIDAVETQYGQSYVSYHYGSGSSSDATTDPWTYPAKTVQLAPDDTASVPAAPNILPDEWTYVTLAFGKNASGYLVDVYYNGTLYCTVNGPYVTGDPMCITAGTGFGGPVLGSSQTPYDQAGTVEIQYVRTFS
jgi:hypothetical protein